MLWDTVGDECFQSLYAVYHQEADGAIFTYDITNRKTFIEVRVWAKSLRRESGSTAAVLVGTKLDLKQEREVSYWEGAQMAERLGALFLETSAKSDINVQQAFSALLAMIAAKTGFSTSFGFERE